MIDGSIYGFSKKCHVQSAKLAPRSLKGEVGCRLYLGVAGWQAPNAAFKGAGCLGHA